MEMAAELLIVALVAGVAAYFVAQNPDLADRILFTRQVLFGLAGLAFAVILIGTGSPALVLIGAIALFLGWLWLFREKPHSDVI